MRRFIEWLRERLAEWVDKVSDSSRPSKGAPDYYDDLGDDVGIGGEDIISSGDGHDG